MAAVWNRLRDVGASEEPSVTLHDWVISGCSQAPLDWRTVLQSFISRVRPSSWLGTSQTSRGRYDYGSIRRPLNGCSVPTCLGHLTFHVELCNLLAQSKHDGRRPDMIYYSIMPRYAAFYWPILCPTSTGRYFYILERAVTVLSLEVCAVPSLKKCHKLHINLLGSAKCYLVILVPTATSQYRTVIVPSYGCLRRPQVIEMS